MKEHGEIQNELKTEKRGSENGLLLNLPMAVQSPHKKDDGQIEN